ncbi:DUF3108 domain-containing protein [Chitiniphilus purpureus]|uniref:DUF3108 domain-containing protein n=1 Tax=Chitiniphilus purpureus TaxID=2981137 RepID=A0ABY6DLL4_9NEIS|nr:DUF3108 domain-containing protein [Chitiniphilus sp. CD1]UXY15260.1 DUF3108 domain-containing protein [Chitiniphilus sp. CD1]
MSRWRARLRVRRWLLVAFVLSLLLHLFGILGDTLYLLADSSAVKGEATPLRKPTQQLADTSFDNLLLPPELQGVTPAGELSIALGMPPPRSTRRAPTPSPTSAPPAATPAPSPVPVHAPTPTPHAMPVAPTPLPAANLSASQPPMTTAASAPTPVPASPAAASPAPTPAGAPAQSLGRSFPRHAQIVYLYGPIPAKLTWRVERGRYEVKLQGSLLGRKRELHSVGLVTRDGVRPERYSEYRDDALRSETVFDWQALSATINDNGNVKTAPLKPGDQDVFSAAFQLALQGNRLDRPTFSLFTGRKHYPDVRFSIRGQSTLRLGEQQVEVLLLRGTYEDRVFDFWLAPQWHNMPVRMQATLGKDGGSYDIWASSIELEGKPVLRPGPMPHERNPHQSR